MARLLIVGSHCFFLFPSTSNPLWPLCLLVPVLLNEIGSMDHHPHPLLVCQQHHLAARKGNKLNSHYWKDVILYSGNFWGRKLSRISRFCGYLGKFSLPNLGAWCPLARHEQSTHESFLPKNRIFHQFAEVFSLKIFQLYGSSTCCSPVMCAKHYLQLSLWTKFHVLINTMEYQAHYCVQGTHSPIPSHFSLIPSLPPSSLPFILYLSIPPTSLLPPSNISAPTL